MVGQLARSLIHYQPLWKSENQLIILNKLNWQVIIPLWYSRFNCGAWGAQRAAKRSPIPIKESKGNLLIDFLVVIMASSIVHGRICMTTTMMTGCHARRQPYLRLTETYSLGFIESFFDTGHPCYGQLTTVKT